MRWMLLLLASSLFAQAVITDSGSTNRPGMSVTINGKGRALIEPSAGNKTKMTIESELSKRLMADLEAAGPLDQLKARHCMKSASFGSRLFVTYKGVRSPDLSCSGQTDPTAAALQKDLQDVIDQAHAKVPATRRFR